MGSIEAPIDFSKLLKDPTLLETRGLVAGEWTFAADKKTFPVYEPSTGRVLLECSDFGQQDFIRAIEVADKGYEKFSSTTTAKERGSMLRRWNDLILSNAEDRECVHIQLQAIA